jgi:hypothetical protein
MFYRKGTEFEEVGRFQLQKNRVTIISSTKDGESLLSEILRRKLRMANGNRIGIEAGSELWLRQLPLNYDGAAVRAKLEE